MQNIDLVDEVNENGSCRVEAAPFCWWIEIFGGLVERPETVDCDDLSEGRKCLLSCNNVSVEASVVADEELSA